MRHTGLLTFRGLLRRRAVLAITIALVLVVPACRGDDKPEAVEVEARISQAVDEHLEVGLRNADLVRAIVAVQDGEVVYSGYFGTTATEYQGIFSVTKSVVSTLVGITVGDGLLSLDDTLSETLPAYADQMKPAVARVTVRDLLTMTAGFPAQASADDPPLLRALRSRDPVAAILAAGSGPGKPFAYSNLGAHLVAAVLAEATGMSVLDYARKELFDPLGIDTRPVYQPPLTQPPRRLKQSLFAGEYESADFAWPTDRRGLHSGESFVKLRPQDMVKLGQLYLDGGVWQGTRILPRAYVQQATTSQVSGTGERGFPDYGYLWWVGEMDGTRAFRAQGFGGQLVVVVPQRRLVVVTSVAIGDSFVTVGLPDMAQLVESAVVSAFSRSD
jgi:CubicO group peptidase (beta-lactamase class C family)